MEASVLYLVVLIFLLCPSETLSQRDGGADRARAKTATPLIAGGEVAPEGRFRYMCSLRHQGNHIHACGGTLIRRDWVLTAAHCIDPNVAGSLGLRPIVYCGIHRLDDPNPDKTFDVSLSFMHESWSGYVEDGYDIALLRLNRNVTLPDLELPELDSGNNQLVSNTVLHALGWGATPTMGISTVLRMTKNLLYVTNADCNTLWEEDAEINDAMICAGLNADTVCKGDSGGPLIRADIPRGSLTAGSAFRDLLVGITSFGYNEVTCGESNKPGVSTRVASFADWINDIIDGGGAEVRRRRPRAPASETAAGTNATALLADLLPAELVEEMKTAFREDNADYAELILEEGLHVNTTLEATIPGVGLSRIPLLHGSAMFDAPKCAQVLIDAGGGVESQISDYYGMKPLHICGVFGSLEVAKVLLHRRNDAAVSSFDNIDDTPLHKAASHGHVELMEFLLTQAENRLYYNTFGDTPLHKAAKAGHVDAVELLLERGANIDFENDDDWTALHQASFNNHTEVVNVLLDNGATVDVEDLLGETPLHKACLNGHDEVIKLLLRNGSYVDTRNNRGYTPLQLATFEGWIESVKLLLRNQASIIAATNTEFTALHSACSRGHVDLAKYLIRNGAPINPVDDNGNSPLQIAAYTGHVAVVRMLLSRGVKVEGTVNNIGETPLHPASADGNVELIRILLRNGADVHAVDNDRETPLHEAAKYGRLEAVKELLDAGALKTARNELGRTPFYLLCRSASPSCGSTTRSSMKFLLTP